MLTPEHKETRITLAGDLITIADKDEFWTTHCLCN
jgi:hypothetical protein